jgi:hypothetical protein
MFLPRPIRPYHFQADLIWWDVPFKMKREIWKSSSGQDYKQKPFDISVAPSDRDI